MPSLPEPTQRYMRNRQLSQHLGISEMTLHRWKRDPKLKTPKGMDVNGIEHNDVSEWDRWLRKRAVSRIEKASA